jgi:hypothetical protein
MPGALAQHEIMVQNIMDQLVAPMHIFDKPGATYKYRDSIYRSLFWEGMHGTTVWQSRSDTCHIGAINLEARDPE